MLHFIKFSQAISLLIQQREKCANRLLNSLEKFYIKFKIKVTRNLPVNNKCRGEYLRKIYGGKQFHISTHLGEDPLHSGFHGRSQPTPRYCLL